MDVREKLIEILEEPCGGLYPACELADYLLSNGVTVQEWISANDSVPKNSGNYLVVHRNKHNGSTSTAIEAYIKCRIGEWWANDYVYDVTHWMPLPQPPKEE